ncbi:MAG: hypothetical protein RLZZ210_1108 [Pseudomonadota bacterium]|jgi:hypothetical protein
MKIIIILAFILIVLSLGSALFFMMKDKGNSNRMLNSLKLRVGLSVSLIILILIAYYMGWIHTTGIIIHE